MIAPVFRRVHHHYLSALNGIAIEFSQRNMAEIYEEDSISRSSRSHGALWQEHLFEFAERGFEPRTKWFLDQILAATLSGGSSN